MMDPGPQVILIACSARKRPGGQRVYQAPLWLGSRLTAESAAKLLEARGELAAFTNLPPGLDVGFTDQAGEVQYFPARERYSGKMYQTADFSNVWRQSQEKVLLIVSALYGLVQPEDLIRWYDLSMNGSGPDGSRLCTWWRRRGLGQLVAECVASYRPAVIHDLFSGVYRQSLGRWGTPETQAAQVEHEFPGLGRGAVYARGRMLRQILEGFAPSDLGGVFA